MARLFSIGIAVMFLNVSMVWAQISFSQHTISVSFTDAYIVEAGDIDADGDIDLVGSGWNGNRVAWWENDGENSFTYEALNAAFSYPSGVDIGDLDGDGDLDVAAGSQGLDLIAWWEFDEGTWTQHTASAGFDGCREIHIADMDGDDDLDILGTALWSGEVSWCENDGTGSFTLHLVDGNLANANSVTAADLDSDGDMDILAASQSDNVIRWYENDGDQAFTMHSLANNNGADWVDAGDVDQDGDMDFFGTSHGINCFRWWENDGEETFTQHEIGAEVTASMLVEMADIDLDGDYDFFLTEAWGGDQLGWWENDGSQSFTEHVIASPYTGARGLDLADMDDDGDLDIITTAMTLRQVDWWENDLDPLPIFPGDLVAPAMDSVCTTYPLTFQWFAAQTEDPALTLEYELQWSMLESFTMYSSQETGTDTVAELTSGLFEDSWYWWRVRSFDPETGWSVYSPQTWRIGTNMEASPPEPGNLLEPVDQTIFVYDELSQVAFAWNNGTDPDLGPDSIRYGLHVEMLIDGAQRLIDVNSLSDTTVTMNLLDSLGVEFWEDSVAASWWVDVISEGDTVTTEPFTFTIEPYSSTPETGQEQPEGFGVVSAYPNPFNPSTTLQFSVSHPGAVSLEVVDILGREVFSENLWRNHGEARVELDGTGWSSGVYFVRICSGKEVQTVKITLQK